MLESIITKPLIVTVCLLVVAAGLAVYFYRERNDFKKKYQKRDDEYRVLRRFYNKLLAREGQKRVLAGTPEPQYSNPQPSPVQTWSEEEVKYQAPAVAEAPNAVETKAYFSLSEDGLFFEKRDTCEPSCVYEAQKVAPLRYEFTIISAARAKAWSIGDAVSVVGNVLQQDAVNFRCIRKGEIVEREDPSHLPYWQITRKTEIEFTR